MKIGEKSYTPRKPANLDERLIEATGCNAAEMARILGASPLAGTVANALLPFLPEKDRPTLASLAREIRAAGIVTVAADVRKLFGEIAPEPAAPEGQPGA